MKSTDLIRMILLSDFTIFSLLDRSYIAYIYLAAIVGFGNMRGGWIVVVLGFSQTDIPVPQFPEAQQASRSIRGNGAVLPSPTLLLRLIPYTEVKGWGLRWGKESESRNNVTAVPLLTSLWCLCQFVLFLSWQNYIFFFWGKGSWGVEEKQAITIITSSLLDAIFE